MACGMRQTITVSYWSVCWKWGFIPYPCKKTKTEVKYRYDFLPWRTRFSWAPFRRSYEGCCNGALFGWSYWTWSPFGTGNGPWIEYQTLTYFSDSTIGSTGRCPFNKGTSSLPTMMSEVTVGSIVPVGTAEELEDHGCPCV